MASSQEIYGSMCNSAQIYQIVGSYLCGSTDSGTDNRYSAKETIIGNCTDWKPWYRIAITTKSGNTPVGVSKYNVKQFVRIQFSIPL